MRYLMIAWLLTMMLSAGAQGIVLKGRIEGATSEGPVSGATIHLLNTGRSVISDISGGFTIPVPAPGKYILEITDIGYLRLEREVTVFSSGGNFTFSLQRASKGLEEVVVTAQKREELLQHIPTSVSALDSRQVREYRLWNNKEITGIVPNLYSIDPGDGRDVVSIKGITSTSYDPAVTTYIDGVGQIGLDTYIPALFDVERIEVLRGPQGTLYGRNAMGGVINIITKQPGNETSGFAELSVGNYGQQRYSAGLRTPLVKDKLFLGAALMYDGRNGYYTNEYTGGSYDKQHSFTGNYYLRWLAGRSWSVDLNVKHRANRNHGAFPLVADPSEVFAHPFVLNQNAVTTMVDNTLDASLALKYHGSAVNFSSQTSFQRNYRYYTKPIDGDFSPLDAISIINDYGKSWNNVKAWTEDIRFSSPATVGSRWKWTAGAYWFFQDQPNKQGTRYGIDANMLQVGDSLFTVINTTKNHRWGVAFYGQAGYALTDRLTFTAGLRYDYEHQWENVNEGYQHDPDPTVYTVLGDTSGRVAFHAFSPKLSLDYRLSDRVMGYVLYSRGFRTGGLTQLSSSPDQPPLAGFKPEYSDNYEAGLKSRVRDVLQLNLAVFYNHVSDVQLPTLILPDAITVTKNTGRMHAYGAELEMDWAPVRGLQVSYQFGYTHARYERSKAAGNETPPDLSGTHQLFTPDVTSMLAAQYGYGLGHGLRAVVRGEWKYIGTRYYATGDGLKESPYTLFNTRVGIEHRRGELMFWMRNIGDRKYVAYAYDFGAWHLGDPRTYGVTLLVRFHQG